MSDNKKTPQTTKTTLHPRNKHRESYDFKVLIESCPALSDYVVKNKYGNESIDFFDAKAVKTLNTALLAHFYKVKFWDIPQGYLCPPIPGRADYIHYMADVLAESNGGNIPEGSKIKCMDIGVGANCVYPIIGNQEYGWSFIGSDIDPVAISSATNIVKFNATLRGKVECRLQSKVSETFFGILQRDERIDISICNPPFHASMEEAQAGTLRKLSNLKKKKVVLPSLNFGGKEGELWTEGGEKRFILNMIRQSSKFSKSCFWFSTLVSKQTNLKAVYQALDLREVAEHKTIEMEQGNKTSRIVVWTFLTQEERVAWAKERWS